MTPAALGDFGAVNSRPAITFGRPSGECATWRVCRQSVVWHSGDPKSFAGCMLINSVAELQDTAGHPHCLQGQQRIDTDACCRIAYSILNLLSLCDHATLRAHPNNDNHPGQHSPQHPALLLSHCTAAGPVRAFWTCIPMERPASVLHTPATHPPQHTSSNPSVACIPTAAPPRSTHIHPPSHPAHA